MPIIHSGQPVQCIGNFVTGTTSANPTDVSAFVYPPSGNVITATVTSSATGRYYTFVTAELTGQYHVRFVGYGDVPAVDVGTFLVSATVFG